MLLIVSQRSNGQTGTMKNCKTHLRDPPGNMAIIGFIVLSNIISIVKSQRPPGDGDTPRPNNPPTSITLFPTPGPTREPTVEPTMEPTKFPTTKVAYYNHSHSFSLQYNIIFDCDNTNIYVDPNMNQSQKEPASMVFDIFFGTAIKAISSFIVMNHSFADILKKDERLVELVGIKNDDNNNIPRDSTYMKVANLSDVDKM